MSTTSLALARSRRTPLASAVAALFALSAPAAYATTFVTNCNDSGAGSLRAGVSSAVEGDTVDASGLTSASPGCGFSRITLSTGAINVTKNSLTIKGPGPSVMAVTAKYNNNAGTTNQYFSRIFNHTGTGTFEVDDMSVTKGYLKPASGDALGGCIYSKAAVKLVNVNVTGCTAKAVSTLARGGGVYAKTSAYLALTNFTFNVTNSGTGTGSYGGALFTPGSLIAKYSAFEINRATNTAHTNGITGGVDARGTLALIHNVTIANNQSDGNIGGLTVTNPGASITLINSTISGNTAPNALAGGAYLSGDDIALYNTTIANNTAKLAAVSLSPGLTISSAGATRTLRLESNLIANNSYGASATQNDISIVGSPTTTGANNLVRTPSGSVPGDTIVGKCPLLKALADNGGPTRTHSFYGHSPAIDAGNNAFGSTSDQRGHPPNNGDTVSYPRLSGPPGSTAVADIGAFELNQTEEIFDSAFEGCP